jgi:hypothetical protein
MPGMKPMRKTQPMRKGGARLQTRGLAAAMTGGNLTGGTPAPAAPNTHPAKKLPDQGATAGPRATLPAGASPLGVKQGVKVGGLGQKIGHLRRAKGPKAGAKAHGRKVGQVGAPATLTNTATSGPAAVRQGQKYTERVNKKGQEIHVYSGGRKVVDATPDGVDKIPAKKGLAKKGSDPERSFNLPPQGKAQGRRRAARVGKGRKRGLSRKLGY